MKKNTVCLMIVGIMVLLLSQGCSSTEEGDIKYVKKYAGGLRNIKNPSESVQLASVETDGSSIQHIKNPSEMVQLAAVKRYGSSIMHIKTPSEAVQLEAVRKDFSAYHHIRKKGIYPSVAVQTEAIKTSIRREKSIGATGYKARGHIVDIVKDTRSENVQKIAVEAFPYLIDHMTNPYSSIKNHPRVLAYKTEQRIAELKRKKEEAELEQRRKENSFSRPSTISSSSSGYSAPKPCHNVSVPKMRTVYVPGGNGRTTQQKYYVTECRF